MYIEGFNQFSFADHTSVVDERVAVALCADIALVEFTESFTIITQVTSIVNVLVRIQ